MLLGDKFYLLYPVQHNQMLWTHASNDQLSGHIFIKSNQLRARQEFSRLLLELGNGTLIADIQLPQRNIIEIPEPCIVKDSLVEELFANTTSEESCSHVILSPKNENCLSMNEEVLKMLPVETKTYLSADSVNCDDNEEAQNYPMEFLNLLTPSGVPPHCLNLKMGSIVMLLCNISLRKDYEWDKIRNN